MGLRMPYCAAMVCTSRSVRSMLGAPLLRARAAEDGRTKSFAASRSVYNWVLGVCERLGAKPDDLVPFDKYAAAANDLVRPSSAARALNTGAPNIERTDRLVQTIAAQYGMRNPIVDQTVATVDARLAANRKAAA